MINSGWRASFSVVSLMFLLGNVSVGFSEELVFTSPPRENSAESSENIYEPVAQYLSRLIGKKVVYHNPGNWLQYQKEMRDGKYDIVFDGPHFVSWRIAHLGHDVVARLPGTQEFLVVARADNTTINTINDLIAKTICTLPPPNFGTMSVQDKFRNPVRQPIIKAIKGESGNVYEAFKNGTCQSAMIRATFYNKKLTDEERKHIKIIERMTAPNQGITASNRLDLREKQLLAKNITADGAPTVIKQLVERYGQKGDKNFVLSGNNEYQGQNQKLEGVIYGW
jgi:ABC transporter, phosphonate, periplasmic substrate-binding protein